LFSGLTEKVRFLESSVPPIADGKNVVPSHEDTNDRPHVQPHISDRQKLLDEIDRARDFLPIEQYQGVDKVFQAIKGLFDSKQVFGETHQNILAQLQGIDLSFLDEVIESISAHSFNLFDVFQVADTLELSSHDKKEFKGAYKSAVAYLRAEAYRESEKFFKMSVVNGSIGILTSNFIILLWFRMERIYLGCLNMGQR
jgi:hypothetical protein